MTRARWRQVLSALLTGAVFAAIVAACASSESAPANLDHIVPIVFAAPTAMPFQVNGGFATGQSLLTATCANPALTTDASATCYQLEDDAGYILADGGLPPIAGWRTRPLYAPERDDVTSGGAESPYPTNIQTNTQQPDVVFNECLALLGADAGFPPFKMAASNVGQGGAPYLNLKRGSSTGNAFQAHLNEATVYEELIADAGLDAEAGPAFGVAAVEVVHGEANANDPAYGSVDLPQWATDYNGEAGIPPITGQTFVFPFVVSQQNEFPPVGSGENLSALGQVAFAKAHPTQGLLSAPKYYRSFCGDRAHYLDTSEEQLGELDCYAWFQWYTTGSWHPLWTGTHSTSGGNTVITMHLSVPMGPLQVDGTLTAPHAAGTTYGAGGAKFPGGNGWTGAYGAEAWDCSETGVPVSISSLVFTSNPSGANVDAVITITTTSFVDTICFCHTADNTTAGTYTGGCPDGRCCVIEDSLGWKGPISGVTQNDHIVEDCISL